jgi:hypothetical protein
MTIEMDKKNTEPTKSLDTALPEAADLSSASFSSGAREEGAREEAVTETVESETVLFVGNGIVNTHTVPEVLSPAPGGASVPVIMIYGKNGSLTFETGELAIAEGPETISEVDIAGPSGRNSYSGNLSNENDVLGADAGPSVETTGTFRMVAA